MMAINGAICTIKHIDFNNSVNDNIPSIIWVPFEDMEVGQLHRYHNKHYMYGNISHTWTPIFAECRETVISNSRVVRSQFPLMPASAVTIHKCQGSSLNNICIDMDVSPSQKFSTNHSLALHFYQHAHYVAASRVKSLNGLQILNWSPELISVNKDVEEHMEYLQKYCKLDLGFTPIYEIGGTYIVSFLNT